MRLSIYSESYRHVIKIINKEINMSRSTIANVLLALTIAIMLVVTGCAPAAPATTPAKPATTPAATPATPSTPAPATTPAATGKELPFKATTVTDTYRFLPVVLDSLSQGGWRHGVNERIEVTAYADQINCYIQIFHNSCN